MALCAELAVKAEGLVTVLWRGYLMKRGGMFKSWNHRFFAISGNFLFEYMTDKVGNRGGGCLTLIVHTHRPCSLPGGSSPPCAPHRRR